MLESYYLIKAMAASIWSVLLLICSLLAAMGGALLNKIAMRQIGVDLVPANMWAFALLVFLGGAAITWLIRRQAALDKRELEEVSELKRAHLEAQQRNTELLEEKASLMARAASLEARASALEAQVNMLSRRE